MKTGIMIAANGARLSLKDHKKVPLNKYDLLKTAKLCAKEGAQAIHLHIRDDKNKHSLDLNKYKETLHFLKKDLHDDFIVQVTSETLGEYNSSDIRRLIKNLKPECASISIKEIIENDSVKTLKEIKDFFFFSRAENIGIQHILYSYEDLIKFNKLLEQEIICGEKHSILFVLGRYSKNKESNPKDLLVFLNTLEKLKLNSQINWMVCAFGQMEIPSLVMAACLGGHLRIGFENSIVLPSGELASNNSSQVKYLKMCLDNLNIKSIDNITMKEVLGIFK
ncbi:MAG: 3-keto-5-aminohexanoate cleavage protein [Campylobacteraceae bacterium]|nr:3-keto-5-aminohexanoate cleavage protein [Campylobacteraceae bacterium]